MQVPFFLAADHVTTGEGGKLTVVGIFNNIYAQSFPARHNQLFLVARIGLEVGEFDVEHDIAVLFVDEDGKEIGGLKGRLKMGRPDKVGTRFADVVWQINGLKLENPGGYEFRLIINRETKFIVPIDAIQINPETAEQ